MGQIGLDGFTSDIYRGGWKAGGSNRRIAYGPPRPLEVRPMSEAAPYPYPRRGPVSDAPADLHLRQPADWPAFLTLHEAAAVLRVSKSTAYEMAQAGTLPTVKFAGRSYRVPRGALARLAGEQLVSVPDGQAPDQQEPAAGVISDPTADRQP
jgi:excisionase family DNA binding protein